MTGLSWDVGPAGMLRLTGPAGELAVLADGAGIDPVDTPKPHLHPLRTPAGVVVTGYAPPDHTWHHGLQFAMPRVDEHNLWGGGTYRDPERGYEVIANQGEIVHRGWTELAGGPVAHASEELRWDGHDGSTLLTESRTWRFALLEDPAALLVDFETSLRSATGRAVSLSTPAQNGRPDGGYGGLFLRLEEGFAAEGITGDPGTDLRASGGRSTTMVVHGRTAAGEPVTLGCAFGDRPERGPGHWLHRFEPFSAICWAVAYTQGLEVPADAPLRFRHRLVVADGHADPRAVRALLRPGPSNSGAPGSAQARR